MTKEEKARAYDEALERAKEYLTPNNPECIDTLDAITTIFPELKESEDEKIRKEIFHFVLENTLSTDMRQHRWLAWLEKQSPLNPTLNEKDRIDDAFTKMMLKESNSNETEDERIRNGLIALLKFSLEDGSAIAPGFNETKEQAIAWLEKQGDVTQLISKAYEKGFTEGKRVERQHWLDKVCKWLNENMADHTLSYEDYEVHSVEPTDYSFKKDFIEAFRKAMEE